MEFAIEEYSVLSVLLCHSNGSPQICETSTQGSGFRCSKHLWNCGSNVHLLSPAHSSESDREVTETGHLEDLVHAEVRESKGSNTIRVLHVFGSAHVQDLSF